MGESFLEQEKIVCSKILLPFWHYFFHLEKFIPTRVPTLSIPPQIMHFFSLLSFLTFLFPCIIHYFLSGVQKTFLFPTLSIPPSNHVFLFFLLSFHAFLFPCMVHYFLSSAQKIFLFPAPSNLPQITHSFFLLSFLAFRFLCIIHRFLSSTQKTFLFHCFSSSHAQHWHRSRPLSRA